MKSNLLVSVNVPEAAPAKGPQRTVSSAVALRALYQLLEDYAPMWYTEEAHDLASAALGESNAY